MKYYVKIDGGDTAEPLNVAKRLAVVNAVGTKGKVILDCGCGQGDYVVQLLSQESCEVFGIEFNQEKVNAYSKRYPDSTNVIQGNIEKMPFDSNKFDVVLLNEVLEHIPDHNRGLSEIYRVLKPNGKIIIFSPNRFYPFETHGVYIKGTTRLVSKAFPLIPYLPLFIGNIFFDYRARNFFPLELRRLLQGHNFCIEGHTYITQTFEGIGGLEFLMPLRKILRSVFRIIEKVPLIRIPFCVSQVLIGSKHVS